MNQTKVSVDNILKKLIITHPNLSICAESIWQAFLCLRTAFKADKKLIIIGNGGSATDSLHIVGELMKSFIHHRALPNNHSAKLKELFGKEGELLSQHLEGTFMAIAPVSEIGLLTAYCNDVLSETAFAQMVYGYGRPDDVLMAISTSGQSKNVLYGCMAARLREMSIVGLTGENGGKLSELCDVSVCVPSNETFRIQEYHLPIYHALCAMLETEFFAGMRDNAD